MKRLFPLFLTGVCLVLSSASSRANEARTTSLVSGFAFEDNTDVFLFPQLAPRYSHGFYLDFANFNLAGEPDGEEQSYSKGNVSAGLIIGKEHAFGLFLNRPATNRLLRYSLAKRFTKNIIAKWDNESISGTVVDALYAHPAGWGIGLRFAHWNQGAESVSEGFDHQSFDEQYTLLEVTPGLTLSETASSRIDLGGRFNFTNVHRGDQGVILLAGVHGRGFFEVTDFWKFVAVASVIGSIKKPREGDTNVNLFLPVQAGGLFTFAERLYASLLAGFEFCFFREPAGNRVGVVLPSIELAGEYGILSWLYLRSGIRQSWGIILSGTSDGRKSTGEKLNFNAGLGFAYKNLRVDGVFQYELWRSAPFLVSGRETGLFTGVSLAFVM